MPKQQSEARLHPSLRPEFSNHTPQELDSNRVEAERLNPVLDRIMQSILHIEELLEEARDELAAAREAGGSQESLSGQERYIASLEQEHAAAQQTFRELDARLRQALDEAKANAFYFTNGGITPEA